MATDSERAVADLVGFGLTGFAFGVWQESVSAGVFCFFVLISACSALGDYKTKRKD